MKKLTIMTSIVILAGALATGCYDNFLYLAQTYVEAITDQYYYFPISDTGQDTSVDFSHTGDDQDHTELPAPAYTDNGNGTISDTVSKLMWAKCSAGQNNDATCTGTASVMSWESARTYCKNLTLGGRDDWRLPTVIELFSLVHFGKYGSNVAAIDVNFPNTKFEDAIGAALFFSGGTLDATIIWAGIIKRYWSSTFLYDTGSGSVTHAWGVSFDDGLTNLSQPSVQQWVRCVRNP